MAKTRIGERLSKVVNESASTKDRSHELEKFNQKFDEFTKTFKPLTAAIKNHLTQLQKAEKSQAQVLGEFAKWIKETPIEVKDNDAVIVHKALLKKDETHSEMYLRNVVEYVHEWELVVKTRVEATQKQARESKQSLDHYEKKMESLSKTHEMAVAKGKTPDTKDVEKLKRNEEKLALAKNSYQTQATGLVNLIEALVDCAWKDLLPLLLRMTKMERDMLDSKKMLLEASEVIANLQSLAEENKIDITTPPPGPVEKSGALASAKVVPVHVKQQ